MLRSVLTGTPAGPASAVGRPSSHRVMLRERRVKRSTTVGAFVYLSAWMAMIAGCTQSTHKPAPSSSQSSVVATSVLRPMVTEFSYQLPVTSGDKISDGAAIVAND